MFDAGIGVVLIKQSKIMYMFITVHAQSNSVPKWIPFELNLTTTAGCRPFDVNPYRAGTELTRFNYVNIMAADVLAPYVARTSAAMILVM